MGCSHGCGPYPYRPHDRGWCGPGDWYDDADFPVPRRDRRAGRPGPGVAPDDLEARLEELRLMVRQIETELGALRGARDGGARE